MVGLTVGAFYLRDKVTTGSMFPLLISPQTSQEAPLYYRSTQGRLTDLAKSIQSYLPSSLGGAEEVEDVDDNDDIEDDDNVEDIDNGNDDDIDNGNVDDIDDGNVNDIDECNVDDIDDGNVDDIDEVNDDDMMIIIG